MSHYDNARQFLQGEIETALATIGTKVQRQNHPKSRIDPPYIEYELQFFTSRPQAIGATFEEIRGAVLFEVYLRADTGTSLALDTYDQLSQAIAYANGKVGNTTVQAGALEITRQAPSEPGFRVEARLQFSAEGPR
jgi:hypothetical protein